MKMFNAIFGAVTLCGLLSAGGIAHAASPAANATTAAQDACPKLLASYTPTRLQDEKPMPLCQFSGKILLVVNTASYCSFATQYEGLEALFAKYASQGLVVIGFPSNDFGKQEPGKNKEIADFCYNTYGVKFPMAGKTEVVGTKANPLFASLAKATGDKPLWNFHKYLIDAKGKPVASYSSLTAPDSKKLISEIERLLAQRKTMLASQ